MFGFDETQATEILSDEKMTPEKWQKIKSLFDVAQELVPEKRKKFLDNACSKDEDLRTRSGKTARFIR